MGERYIPDFGDHYPTKVAGEIEYSNVLGESAYSPANPITTEVINSYLDKGAELLGKGALELLDVGGGDGEKHALPVARSGNYATILDIDPTPLRYARRKARPFPKIAAQLRTVCGDAENMSDQLREDLGEYDIAVNVGYVYLAPEDIVRRIFKNTTELLNDRWHASVVQFNTNIQRFNQDGEPRKGENEQIYTGGEGKELVASLFEENGFATPDFRESKLDHDAHNLRVTADVLIAYAEGGELLAK